MKDYVPPEELLYIVWQFKLYKPLFLTDGRPISVVETGIRQLSGPDFCNAQVIIDGLKWVGCVEIHRRSSDWFNHHHTENPEYNNVILHVVWEDDGGPSIPTVELKHFVYEEALSKWEALAKSPSQIPCHNFITPVKIYQQAWLVRMATERLQDKYDAIREILIKNQYDWLQVLYELFMRYMGVPANTEHFQLVAHNLPYRIIARHSDSDEELLALLYGISGWLDYLQEKGLSIEGLWVKWNHLKSKYNLAPLGVSWKRGTFRPYSHPLVRMAQAVSILKVLPLLWEAISVGDTDLASRLLTVEPPSYWIKTVGNVMFPKLKTFKTGSMIVNVLIINVLIPMMFAFGKSREDEQLSEQAIVWLDSMPPEDNSVIRKWKQIGIKPHSAMETQALLHLYRNYCQHRRCLQCQWGRQFIANVDKNRIL